MPDRVADDFLPDLCWWKPCNVEKDYMVGEDGQFYQDRPQAAINPANPEAVLMVDGGRAYLTTDGGKHWKAVHTQLAPGETEAGKTPACCERSGGHHHLNHQPGPV